ncbi:hypothetical protein NMY22_g8083 [Coprinellus aureogranulatus]|nr:hypothetical protein NMY22_g8083 [Coprinellus aureogranulatus]
MCNSISTSLLTRLKNQEEWKVNFREDYLREMIWLEGRGQQQSQRFCPGCSEEKEVVYRCRSCIGAASLCKECMVSVHAYDPFHFIEKWNGSFFEATTLKTIGLRIQLNHPPGRPCPAPIHAHNHDFVILDVTGIHEVGLWFCGCDKQKARHVQLLRYRLFPGTGTDPRSAATFRCLKFFQIMSFESKGSHEEFYRTIVRMSGDVKVKATRDRYHEFLVMVSQWRHLVMLKRSGRGHASGGIKGTKVGDCALRCPACPRPGVNLPNGWEFVSADKRWIYRLFVSIDGNFRLKRRMVSSDERDPGLNEGWAYFVEDKAYRKHLLKHWDAIQERSTCVAHDAVDKPDREARGLAASGVVAVVCTRHEFRLPTGLGDLQKGEKYINVDYISWSGIRWFKIRELAISYDIACQWFKRLKERLQRLPKDLRPTQLTGLRILIPKFHLPAHIEYCNRTYSFNLTQGVGRSDGEAPERGWSRMNTVGKSTTEMGPGMRRDTIDDHSADLNWQKSKDLAVSMETKMVRAVAGSATHEAGFAEFRDSIPEKFAVVWVAQAESWEAKPSAVANPFEAQTQGVSEQAVRLQLAREAETADSARECDDTGPGRIHPSLFISQGIQLEEDQFKLRQAVSALGNHPTKKELTAMAERSNALRRRIGSWIETQRLYVPDADMIRSRSDAAATEVNGKPASEAYDIPLLLPSALPWTSCSTILQRYEVQLREGQAYDALNDVRRHLRLRSYLYKRKDAHARGVAANTRSNTAIKRAQKGVDTAVAKYRRVRKALLTLCGEVPAGTPFVPERWRGDLQDLKSIHVRGLSEGLFSQSEGTREISWIWMSRSAPVTKDSDENIEADEQLQDALRIEFLRCRARAMRWREEVTLLEEEMRRIKESFKYQAEWWGSRVHSTIGGSGSEYDEGFEAYAKSQCAVYQTLRTECEQRWHDARVRDWAKAPRRKGKRPVVGVDTVDEGPRESSGIVIEGNVDMYDDFD